MHEFNPRHIELRIVFPHIFRALLLSELLDHRFHGFGVVTGTHTEKHKTKSQAPRFLCSVNNFTISANCLRTSWWGTVWRLTNFLTARRDQSLRVQALNALRHVVHIIQYHAARAT